MIPGEKYYFFRMTPFRNGALDQYRIAKSFEDLYQRFGSDYLSQYHSITITNEVTIEHIEAINLFLLQETFS